MSVVQVAFGREAERPPHLVEVFCVQAYWRDTHRLVKGRWEQFFSMEAALRAGKKAAVRSPSVVVYRVRGNVDVDYWEPPVTIASYGEVPEVG